MRRDDDGEVGVLIDDALRPLNGFFIGAPAQRKVEVLLTLSLKDVSLGVIIDRSVALLEGLRVCGLGAIGAKPLVIRVGRRPPRRPCRDCRAGWSSSDPSRRGPAWPYRLPAIRPPRSTGRRHRLSG